MMRPITASRWRRKRRNAARLSDVCSTATICFADVLPLTVSNGETDSACSAKANPRIDAGIEDIDKDVGDQYGRPHDEHDPHHQGRVAIPRRPYRKLTHAGPREDLFGDDG